MLIILLKVIFNHLLTFVKEVSVFFSEFIPTLAAIDQEKMRFNTPNDYIQYLAQGGRSENDIYSCVQLLTKALEKNPLSWVHEFGVNGLNQVLRILYEIYQT